ncbi:MAG: DUF3291 domain-containing protein [Bacteroidota bacterium]
MMQYAHADLVTVEGMEFYKLMGSGRGLGFNPWPDWSTHAILQVWETEAQAEAFFENAPLPKRYQFRTSEMATIYLRAIRSHGVWSGGTPFRISNNIDSANPFVAVITRATIRARHLVRFWRYVPTSQRPIATAKGLLYTKGIGEAPIKQMATFSIWENQECLTEFAYRSKEHQKAIKMTRDLSWYSEELFVRFQPYRVVGELEGLPLVF